MGRKSNAKKKKREIKDEEQKPEIKEKKDITEEKSEKEMTKKEKKEKKKEEKKKKKEEKPPRKINKKKIFGGILVLIMIGILVSVGFLLFQKAFRADPIAKYLPPEKTIAFIEINTDFNHHQLVKTENLLKGHPQYSKSQIIKSLEEKYLFDFQNEIKPWLGRQIGMAALTSEKTVGNVNMVYFAEVFSQKMAIEKILKGKNSEKYSNHDIYFEENGKTYTFLGDYMFIGDNRQIIEELIDFNKTPNDKLYADTDYRRIDDNMPISKLIFVYINFSKVPDNFFQYFPYLKNNGFTAELLQPIIRMFKTEGLAVVAQDDKFAVQSFVSLNTEEYKDSQYISFKEKYSADLADYVVKDTLVFWGGENLEYQVKRLLEVIAGENKEVMDLFESLLQNYIQKYFGPEVSLKNDILPLFSNEFALAIEEATNEDEEIIIYKLLLELEDPNADAVKIHEIADNFAEISAVFEPKVVEHVLEDGTVSKEIVAVPEKVKKTETKYENTTIYQMDIGEGSSFSINYTVIDNIAVISSNIKGVENAIDAKNNKKQSLKSSETFLTLIEPVLKSSDEVSYFNFEKLLTKILNEESTPEFLNIISSFSSGKNYFNDGITTINYLRIK